MSESKGIYAYAPRVVLTGEQMFKVMTWLEKGGEELVSKTNEEIAAFLEGALGFRVSPQTISRLTKGKRTKLKEKREAERLQRRAELMRERAQASAVREHAPDDSKKQISIVARAIIRLYDGLGSKAPSELEKIAYQNL